MTERVLTKAAMQRASAGKVIPPVLFIEHARRMKKSSLDLERDEQNSVSRIDQSSGRNSLNPKPIKQLSMKQARQDVIRLAGSSGTLQEKQDAKVALALRLGAAPPKRKAINYRELQDRNKAAKEAVQAAEKLQGLGKVLKQSSRPGSKKTSGRAESRPTITKKKHTVPKKLSSGILGQYGKVKKGGVGGKRKGRK